jgi:6-phosphofructokinase
MNIGILTGGGDVQPLNAVIAAVKSEVTKVNGKLYGFLNGWDGILNNNFIILNEIEVPELVGGTILKSSRVNIKKVENSFENFRNNFSKLGLEGLIVIGGEDTLSNVFYFDDLPIVMLSKTIDNDVGKVNISNGKYTLTNHFTLGHPTAAEKIASFVSLKEGLRTTAYSHERIIIVESMGMHAGWLALSSGLGAPDFIIIPEFPLNYEKFIELLIKKFRSQKNAIVVVSEGAKWSNGDFIAADYKNQDSFGHPKFLGSAKTLSEKVKESFSKLFDTRNINFVNPSYLYRSGKPNELDYITAYKLGEYAVKLINHGLNKPCFIAVNDDISLSKVFIEDIGVIDNFHRFVPCEFYDIENYQISQLGINYVKSLGKSFDRINYNIK